MQNYSFWVINNHRLTPINSLKQNSPLNFAQVNDSHKYNLLRSAILKHLVHSPTSNQEEAISGICNFLFSHEPVPIFVLKGYAGTGKTTLVSSLVNALDEFEFNTVLLAPTGRAAKVIGGYSGKPAFTIHKKIYFREQNNFGAFHYALRPNTAKNTLFIVDEASMIGEGGGLNNEMSSSLLSDLIQFVYSGSNCMLLLVGDIAQLPPVGSSVSPALDLPFLKASYSATIYSVELREVLRQSQDSGILYNATALRIKLLQGGKGYPSIETKGFKDVIPVEGVNLQDMLESSYANFGVEGTIVLCRSNKRAVQFNRQIRLQIRYQESDISTGDYLMVVKNNYFWLGEQSKAGFIANGDSIQVLKIGNFKELYGLHFADAQIQLLDYPDEPVLEVKLLLDTLHSETPSLSNEESKRFYQAVAEDYADEPNKLQRNLKIKNDPYFNALQVKFAYAITCHKAQGGQWNHVYIDQGFLTEDALNTEYYRWLYTAITRATDKVYFINFKEDFFA